MMETLLAVFAALGAVSAEPRPYEDAQLAVLKVYGEGGVAGLEGYQTGVLIDSEERLVLTADSVALDSGRVAIVDAFGDRFEALLRARDTKTGLALLECSVDINLPVAPLERRALPESGARVWVLSNAFNIAAGTEPVTVQRARVAVSAPIPLTADRRPRPGTPAVGETVVLLDAVTSNPGAAGGLVVNDSGGVVGILGAECRSPLTGAWINYAIPVESVIEAVERMRAGGSDASAKDQEADRPWRSTLWTVGVGLVPTLGPRTPPYLEAVAPGSEAAAAGLRPDDLVVAVDGVTVSRVESAGRSLARALLAGSVRVTVLRGERILTLTIERKATR